MKILAFDQSTVKTGWSVFQDGQLLESGVFDVHKEKDVEKRSAQMYEFLVWKTLATLPDVIAAEEVSLQNPNVKTIVELARVQGLIQAAAYSIPHENHVVFYTPSKWRKAVGIQTGKGIKRAELKRAAVQMVSAQYDKDVSDDEADAILIGQAACSLSTENKENKEI